MSSSFSYRPDIDGLRAVAVLGVLFFHAGLGFPGGYVGVDVFFVISGFLITSLLLRDLRAGTFSLWDFWERRARRILPALSVLVAAVLVAGWFYLVPRDYETVGKQVIALALFSSNVKFWRESGYFSSAAEEKPMLHTWSLSVEEQFYLCIPILLAVLYRYRRSHWCLPVLLGGALASFALSVYGSYRSPTATFFLLPTRAWELIAGGLLAFAPAPGGGRQRAIAAWSGLAAILLPYFLYAPGIRFPGLTALPPVAGAVLLIWAGLPGKQSADLPLASRLLAWRPLVWIGLLSYSLYLWHWPIFAFQKYLGYATDRWPVQLGLALAAFPLAWLSLEWVERPFRSRKTIRSRSTVFAFSGAVVGALVFASLVIWQTDGAEGRLSEQAKRYAAGANDFAFRNDLQAADVPDNLVKFGVEGDHPHVLVWGDSHAMAILPAVDAVCRELGLVGQAATRLSTAPVIDWCKHRYDGPNLEALPYNHAVFQHAISQLRNGIVILAARWGSNLSNERERAAFRDAFANTIRRLTDADIRVIVVRETPMFTFDPPREFTLAEFRRKSHHALITTSEQHERRAFNQNQIFNDYQHHPAVAFCDPAPAFRRSDGHYIPGDEGGVYYRDSNHLSIRGAARLESMFKDSLSRLVAGSSAKRHVEQLTND